LSDVDSFTVVLCEIMMCKINGIIILFCEGYRYSAVVLQLVDYIQIVSVLVGHFCGLFN